MRGEPRGFWPRVRYWFGQHYLYWERVEKIERALVILPEFKGASAERMTEVAEVIAARMGRA